MKTLVRVPAAAMALAVVAAVSGCTTTPGAQPSATPTATPAQACPVGSWKSTNAEAKRTVGGVAFSLQGGSDVTMTVAPDGAVKSDFAAMTPVGFTVEVSGAQLTGEYLYQGTVSGTVTFSGSPTATSGTSTATTPATTTSTSTSTSTATSPAGAGASGQWRPTGPVTTTDLRITVKLTKPLATTVIDNVKVGDVSGAQAAQVGNVLDIQPTLHAGEYKCGGNDTLTLNPSGGTGPMVVWTFSRA